MEYFMHDKKGAQVLRAALESGLELLYLSPLVDVYPDNPICGVIPLLFPQFVDFGQIVIASRRDFVY